MTPVDDGALVRRLGVLVESVHAVVYFAPEPQAAYADLGLKGYWRGYFASRERGARRSGTGAGHCPVRRLRPRDGGPRAA